MVGHQTISPDLHLSLAHLFGKQIAVDVLIAFIEENRFAPMVETAIPDPKGRSPALQRRAFRRLRARHYLSVARQRSRTADRKSSAILKTISNPGNEHVLLEAVGLLLAHVLADLLVELSPGFPRPVLGELR